MYPPHGNEQPVAQLACSYVPESTPLEHSRLSPVQVGEPAAAKYAVTLAPCATVLNHGVVQSLQEFTAQLPSVYEPESVPSVQVRVSRTVAQEPPHATVVAE